MRLYDYTGAVVFDSARETGEVGTSAPFNFSAISEAAAVNTGLTKSYHAISGVLGELQYVGGICVNKKIYCAPNKAQSILVYDTEAERLYTIGDSLGNFKFKYTGAVYWQGYVYLIPRGVNTMLRIDPISDDVTVIDLGTTYPVTPYGDYRDSHHYNGAISEDGFLYCPPAYSSNKLLKINMRNFEWEELDFNSSDVSTWIGCVKHPTQNKIIFLSTKVFRVWDCDTDTFTDVNDGVTRPCYDMVYDPRYEAFIGFYSRIGEAQGGGGNIFALKTSDWSCIDSGYINYLGTGYGASIGPDGHYYHIEGAGVYDFTFDGTSFVQQTSITTSDNVGSGRTLNAGQAIDNDGNIYGIPGNGVLTKLTFGNVVKGWPDAIVSSQYYGKY